MSFLLAEPPGFTDLPETLLVGGQSTATGFLMSAIKDNAAFGTVAPEFFSGYYTDGQQVPLPISSADQRQYQRQECFYVWELMNTTNTSNGLPGANGGLLWGQWRVDQATGKVSCTEAYYVPGGAQTNTHDGVLKVTTIAVRGRNLRKMSAQISGALTGGSFQVGERIQQTTSNATAYVDTPAPGAAGPLQVLAAVMGTPDATHTWVGQTSGAVFTPSALPTPVAPAYTDLPASSWNSDDAVAQTILRQLNRNAKLASVRTECFLLNPSGAPVWSPGKTWTTGQLMQPTGRWANGCWYVCAQGGASALVEPGPWPSDPTNPNPIFDGEAVWNIAGEGFTFGQQVPLPVSPFDGYEYSQAEIYVVMPFFTTTLAFPVQKGVDIVWTSGKGDIRALSKNILPNQPASPSVTPYGGGSQVQTGTTVQTSWNFGSTPPAEIHEPALLSPGAPTTGCGFLYNAVWFKNGPFADGACQVLVIASRALGGTMAAPGGANYVDFDTDLVLSGEPLPQAVMQNINENAKFAILRPEAQMEFNVGPGITVPVPVSPWDGYEYEPSECQYLEWWTSTGAAPGDLRDFSVMVNPVSGVVCTRTDYYRGAGWTVPLTFGLITFGSGSSIATAQYGYPGSPIYTGMPATGTWGIPSVNAAVLQSRSRETEEQPGQIVSTPGNTLPAGPGSTDLLLNGGFEIWTIPGTTAVAVAGVADDWWMLEDEGTTAFLQEAGIVSGSKYAQGVGAQCVASTLGGRAANPVNRASIESTIIPIDPNGLYSFKCNAQASPNVINYGFYIRVHLLDENLANDTAFELLWPDQPSNMLAGPGTGGGNNPGSPLNTSVQTFGPDMFAIPANGATAASTSSGLSVLHQNGTPVTLGFTPAYLYIEADLWSPMYTGWGGGSLVLFAVLDNFDLENITGSTMGPPASGGTPPVNSAQTLSTNASLSQVSTGTEIDVSANELVTPYQTVDYDAGSVDPGSYGTWYIYCLDPQLAGGAVDYLATQNLTDLTSQPGVVRFGVITTSPAGGGAGGGTGGSGGSTTLTITSINPHAGEHDIAYTYLLGAYGGLGPYTWSIPSGSLPAGITLNSSTGEISGTTSAPGTYPFTAKVADSSTPQNTATQYMTIVIG